MRKEIPILFSTDMVAAILEGRKTMTRRVVKRTALQWLDVDGFTPEFVADPENNLCPYGKVGDVLWVREKFFKGYILDDNDNIPDDAKLEYWFYADTRDARPGDASDDWCYHMYGADKSLYPRWKPSIFMPKDAARIWLEVVNVRVERLHEISQEDAEKEGLQFDWSEGKQFKNYANNEFELGDSRQSFETLWQKINGMESWDANPWVWVVEFNVLSVTGKPNHINAEQNGEVAINVD